MLSSQYKTIRMRCPLILLFLLMFLISCSDEKQDQVKSFEIDGQTEDGFESGDYCAEVTYFNPRTGTHSEYTLKVEVDDNKVEKIFFGNGGWLDSDHMTPQELDEEGECTIISFEGPEYNIKIKDRNCPNYSSVSLERPKPHMTFADCARLLSMTYQEIETYKRKFDEEEMETYTTEMCELLRDYLQKIRKLNAELEVFENGFIHFVHSSSNGNYIRCQAVISKKYDTYFWLDVLNPEQCKGGVLEFDASISGYQDVIVREFPETGNVAHFRMKIVMIDENEDKLKKLIESSCGHE